MTGLYERSQALSAPDDEARAASAEFAYCELLLCGVTSLVDITVPWPGWIDLFARSVLPHLAPQWDDRYEDRWWPERLRAKRPAAANTAAMAAAS